MQDEKLEVKQFCRLLGADLFGVADIGGIKDKFKLSPKVLARLDRAISIGVRLSDPILEEIEDRPSRLYFHHYRSLNFFLDQLALRLTGYIQDRGHTAMPIPASVIFDWKSQTAHLSHKEIGFLAGLGWIGRNNLLVNPKLGCRFRMVTVLTDMPLESDGQMNGDCGDCRACIKVCPAGAIRENPEEFDHLGCFEKLKEFQKRGLVSQYICGVCIRACPIGK
jgi:epoxyqueuosine reductase QueG